MISFPLLLLATVSKVASSVVLANVIIFVNVGSNVLVIMMYRVWHHQARINFFEMGLLVVRIKRGVHAAFVVVVVVHEQ